MVPWHYHCNSIQRNTKLRVLVGLVVGNNTLKWKKQIIIELYLTLCTNFSFYEHKKLSAVYNIFQLLLIDFSSSNYLAKSTFVTKARSPFVFFMKRTIFTPILSHSPSGNFWCQDLQHPEDCIAVPHFNLHHSA